MINKNTLRKVYLQKRLTLSQREYEKRNHLLEARLIEYLNVSDINYIHIFLAMVEKNEVDTFSIIETLRELNPAITIAVSKTLPKGELSHYVLNEHTKIVKSNWGVPEPVEGEAAHLSAIEVILVPLISFDKTGHRIGYGKGYYDRFLKKMPQARKIGLALTPPLDEIIYADDEMDVRLDACVSPFSVYHFAEQSSERSL